MESQHKHNWVNENRELLKKYRGEWIAIDYNVGVIAHDIDLSRVTNQAENIEKNYVLWFVPKFYRKQIRILPIHVKTFILHEWSPFYDVELIAGQRRIKQKMLVDSGADVSLIPYELGQKLGLELAPYERIDNALGIGGSVEYVIRVLEFNIDTHLFKAPVAWLQTPECKDIILGRDVVFDTFDIEFKQADEKIIFKLRPETKISN